jgi:hypothetical protein
MTLAEHLKHRNENFNVLLIIGLLISIEKFVGQQRLLKIEACHVTSYFLWDDQVHLDGWMDRIDFVLQVPGIRYRALVCAPSSIVTEQLKGARKGR